MYNSKVLIALSTIFAFIPIIIWLYITFSRSKNSKKTITFVFLLGCFTAPALLLSQYIPTFIDNLSKHFSDPNTVNTISNISKQVSEWSPLGIIDKITTSGTSLLIGTFILFALLEEVIKLFVIISIDKKTVLIKTIGDSMKFAIAAALGFSFGENIYYLHQFWIQVDTKQLIGMYIYRSIFTTCAHMIYSGIFGYFYGIGKFAIDITKQKELIGEKSKLSRFFSRITFSSENRTYQDLMIIKGLFIAILMHASSNFLLEKGEILPVVIFVILGYAYLQFLLKRKSGNLILSTDISTKRKSTIAKKDEDIVLELIGMWFKEKNYTDVIHICERLLERDPDNNVVKIFKAKAIDEMQDTNSPYKDILTYMFNRKERNTKESKNIISKHLEEKENIAKVKKMIKKQLKKEGKKFIDKEKERKKKKKEEKTNTQDKTTYNINI